MLEFDNVTLLTYQHTPTFFEAGLRYKIVKNFTIVGRLLSLANTDGVGPTWSQAETLQAGADDYEEIILNGISFGRGKILNVSLESGIHVKQQQYTYTIQCYAEGNLFNGLTGVYQDIDWSSIHIVERLSEDFSYDEDGEGNKEYGHNLSIRFNRNVENLGVNPIDLAKDLAQNLLEATNLVGLIGDYNSHPNAKKLYTESYSKIDFNCSITERVSIPSVQKGSYSLSLSYQVQLNEQGVTTISEKGEIRGIDTPIASSANQGFSIEGGEGTVYARCASVYNAYNFSTLPLHAIVTQKSVTINKFEGSISYDYSFTNDPRIDDIAIWDYTIQINRTPDNYLEVTESGTVKGFGRPRKDKYANAENYYNTKVKNGIAGRIATAYARFGGKHATNLILVRRGFGRSEFSGELNYSQTWTDNNLYTDDDKIRRAEISVTTNYPTHIVLTVKVINFKEVIQPTNNSSVGSRSISIKLKGRRNTTLSEYLTYAKGIITDNNYNSIGDDTYISGARYTYNPNGNDFSLDVSLNFHGFYKAFGDLSLT